MKKCVKCGAQVPDDGRFCPTCGSAELVMEAPIADQLDNVQTNGAILTSTYQPQNLKNDVAPNNGNIFLGIIGAILFSMIGGLLYFGLYQAGFIAGISGFVIFWLSGFGYRLFAKTKDKTSIVSLIFSVILMIVVIYLAEFFCVSNEIVKAAESEGATVTFMEAVEMTPDFLKKSEVSEAVTQDLVYAYVFGFIATIGSVINIVKARKRK